MKPINRLKQVFIPTDIYAALEAGRDRFNKHLTLGDYLEHLIAVHAKVMDMQEKQDDKSEA